MQDALVFTRTKHRANRLSEQLDAAAASTCARIHGNRSQAQRTDALAGFKSGTLPRPRRHRHRRARHRRRGARPRRQLRRAARARGLHPPRRPHGARRGDRRRVHVRRAGRGEPTCARSSARSASACRASRCPTSTTPRGRPSASRCRSPSASPRSASASRRSGPAPGSTPSGGPGTVPAAGLRAAGTHVRPALRVRAGSLAAVGVPVAVAVRSSRRRGSCRSTRRQLRTAPAWRQPVRAAPQR